MRLAVLTAFVLLTGVHAYADVMVIPQVQETAPSVSVVNPGALEMTLTTASVNPLSVQELPTAQLAAQPSAVTPEPSTMVMMSTGMIAVFALAWRRRAVAARSVATATA